MNIVLTLSRSVDGEWLQAVQKQAMTLSARIFIRAAHSIAVLFLLVSTSCAGTKSAPPGPRSTVEAARTSLLEMMRLDQAVQFDPSSNPIDELHNQRIDQQFADDVPKLEGILNEFGWPSRGVFGDEASKAAFLIAQHADRFPEFQRRCLNLLADAVTKSDASPTDFAFLTDRVLKNAGEPQRFGTQWDGDELWPIGEPERIEQRRASVGLNTLAAQRADHQALLEHLRAAYHIQ